MKVIRPWLFIGKYRDTLNLGYLQSKCIQAMLQLANKVEQPGITSLYLPLEDLALLKFDSLEKNVTFINEQKKIGNSILIACAMGINRSSSYCTAALMKEEGISLFDAFREVKRKHSESMPHEPVWESLRYYYNEKVSYLDIMQL